jgi:dipeptidyl aminopeptidase/acylaminoacyl peptidase
MVLLVHGGPWARDTYGFNAAHQLLANRGYGVLSVNFRGSTGFGKDFTNAGNLQWGLKMHDDLIDAVKWAVDQGIAQADKIAIMGGSYGGYATLAGLTFTPEVFACGIDIVGPSNLETLLKTIPPYWEPLVKQFHDRMGNPHTKEGLALLRAASPLYKADKIVKPLLIGQGANDPRVAQAESDQIVGAMKAAGIPVTYVLYPDEGHGFARPENSIAFYAIAENFLAECIGGRAEPIGDVIKPSSAHIVDGAAHVKGLEAALGG